MMRALFVRVAAVGGFIRYSHRLAELAFSFFIFAFRLFGSFFDTFAHAATSARIYLPRL